MRTGAPRYEETGGDPAALVSRLCSLPVPFPAVAARRNLTSTRRPGLVLPEGNGALSYSLEPEIPALTFDAATRVLSGTPSRFRHAAGRPKSVAPSGDTTSRTACVIIRSSRTAPMLVQALPPWLT